MEGSVKRLQSDIDDDMPNKRPRSGGRAVDIRFLLQSRNAGAIIGKGGSNINKLRREYKASISVPDCPGPERILSIIADVDTLGEILLNIIPKLEDYSHHRTLSFDCEMRMLLHQSHAGCIIGRAGYRIKELREKTGANIKVHGNCCPASTERIVKISGFPNVVVDCIKEICDIISEAPIKGLNKPYDPHNFDPEFSSEYGGYAEGGGHMRGGGQMRNAPFWRDEPVEPFNSFGMPRPDLMPKRGGRGGGGWGGSRGYSDDSRGGGWRSQGGGDFGRSTYRGGRNFGGRGGNYSNGR